MIAERSEVSGKGEEQAASVRPKASREKREALSASRFPTQSAAGLRPFAAASVTPAASALVLRTSGKPALNQRV